MKSKQILLYLSLFVFNYSIFAQEHIGALKTNPVLVRYTEQAKISHKAAWNIIGDSIMAKLPFLDDFSRPGPYPFDSLWMDNAAFVNNTYPICPYTLGVVTLDGVNSEGRPYNPNCPPGASYPADSLTSRPINLSIYSPSDSIWFSFYYQSGGRAPSPPLPGDTLLLQFRTSKVPWTTVWYLNGYTPSATDTNFHRVMIPIKSPIFTSTDSTLNPFDVNFQFRFKNYACTSANVDQWNIDEVYMDQRRSYTDTAKDDVSFVYESPSLLANYEYMPWEQFTDNDLKDTMYIQERNNGINVAGINTKYYDSIPAVVPGYSTVTVFNAGNYDILPFYDNGYNNYPIQTLIPIKSKFLYNQLTKPTDITLIHILSLSRSSDFVVWNDTLRFDQSFYDYYAYDDGTAEAAYFINGTPPLYLAQQFTLNNEDTLRGLELYFDYTFTDPANYNMRLAVWDNTGPDGSPGNILFEDDSVVSPKVSISLNGFNFYPYHTTTPLWYQGGTTIYVGWVQTIGDSLNIGYDLNTDHHTQICYYDNAFPSYWNTGWNPGTIPGSMMMRPVFGNQRVLGESSIKNPYESIGIYPNPASDIVNFSKTLPLNTILKIYTADGKEYLSDSHFSGNSLNTSILPAGFYIVEITTSGGNTYYQKLLIQR